MVIYTTTGCNDIITIQSMRYAETRNCAHCLVLSKGIKMSLEQPMSHSIGIWNLVWRKYRMTVFLKTIIHSFIPLACAECDDSLPFSGASSIPLCYVCTFSSHSSPPTILPSSLISSCHLFFGLPLSIVVPKFIYSTLLGILFSSILCTCPNQRNLFNRTVSIIVGF